MADKLKVRHIDADAEARSHLAEQLERAKNERVPEILTVLLFALFIAAFAISFWVLPDREFSDEERRYLDQMPKLTAQSLTAKNEEDKFTKKFADYMADQFPLRDAFVGVKGAAEIALGKFENNGVFVLGDSLAVRFDEVNETNLGRNLEGTDAFLAACRERGVNARFALFGRTMDVTDVPVYGSGTSDAAYALLDGHDFVDMRAALEGHEDVYYRTDHHHTSLGAYYAYGYLAQYYGYEANGIDHYTREVASDGFYGTTWEKAGAKWVSPDTIEYFHWDGDEDVLVTIREADSMRFHRGMYFRDYLEESDKYSSFLENAVIGRVDVTTPGAGKPKLLVIKDSFAHSLVPFLAEHYDVTMIDPRYYNQPVIKLVDDEGFDEVLICCNMETLSTSANLARLQIGLKG